MHFFNLLIKNTIEWLNVTGKPAVNQLCTLKTVNVILYPHKMFLYVVKKCVYLKEKLALF